jgi:putative GTP pyrophosphokinase
MTPFEIEIEYNRKRPLFERTIENFQQAIVIFLKEKEIPFLDVSGRIKDLSSFFEKIDRKQYSNPFNDNEDFCGIRVIVYYPNDIEEVQKIIDKEFDLQNSIDKAEELEVNEFGYRSKHSIVKIKKEWLSAPNYRGMEDIKVEIQVRTILMHAWAEIEHKLAYKSKQQIPRELQRQLFRLSAKFEESDEQFQSLKEGIEKYRQEIKENVKDKHQSKKDIKLNLDSLSALLDYYLPSFPNNQRNTSTILNEFILNKVLFSKVEELLKNIKPYAIQLNNEVFPNKDLRLTQATILSYARDIYWGYNTESQYTESRKKIVEKLKQKIKNGS